MAGGGKLIEILRMKLPETGREVVRLWVVGTAYGSPGMNDETCVYAEPQDSMPTIGDTIWWGGGRWIKFDGDRQEMTKVGYSFPAPGSRS